MNNYGYLIHKDDGSEYLEHRSHKYIDRIRTSRGWRYIYEKSGLGARDRMNEADNKVAESIAIGKSIHERLPNSAKYGSRLGGEQSKEVATMFKERSVNDYNDHVRAVENANKAREEYNNSLAGKIDKYGRKITNGYRGLRSRLYSIRRR